MTATNKCFFLLLAVATLAVAAGAVDADNTPSRPRRQAGPRGRQWQGNFPRQPGGFPRPAPTYDDYDNSGFVFDRNPPGGGRPNFPTNPQPGAGSTPRPGFTVADVDVTTPTTGTTFAGCKCPTTPEFNPACGSDRVTYFNPGRVRCANRCGYRVTINHMGSCIAPATTQATPAARRGGR